MKDNATIVVFAGAGASKAVAPDKYPTTIEFFNDLPDNITEKELFKQTVEFLKQDSGDGPIDIELLLWRLSELKDFCSQFHDTSNLPGWILSNNRLGKAILRKHVSLGEAGKLLATCSRELDVLVSDINKRVYDLYGQLPENSQLENTWDPLFNGLEGFGAKIEVVTSNYDMILESALDNNKVADIGWRGSIVRSLDTSLWDNTEDESSLGLLTKLHGSINWTKNDEKIFVGDPTFKNDHDAHAIIYPGFKGRPVDATFLSFHNYFSKALSEADVAIFIGFAFRDEYINDICERSVRGQTRIGILNPERNLDLPFLNTKVQHWEKGFDKDSVREVLAFVRETIEV